MDSKIVLVAAMSRITIGKTNLRTLLNKRIWVLATIQWTRDADYQGRLRDDLIALALDHLAAGRIKITKGIVNKIFP